MSVNEWTVRDYGRKSTVELTIERFLQYTQRVSLERGKGYTTLRLLELNLGKDEVSASYYALLQSTEYHDKKQAAIRIIVIQII